MRTRAVFIVTLVVAAARAFALDPGRAPSQYVVSKWAESRLRGHTVRALLQTRDGYLWLGTTAGLVRHDGVRFVVFDAQTTPVIGDGGVSSLAEGADGALYFGTTAGSVIRYQDGLFARVPVRDGTGPVYALLADREAGVWIAQHGYPIAHWAKGAAASTYISEDQTLAPHAMLHGRGDTLWLGTSGGLTHGQGRVFTHHRATEDLVQALCLDRDGVLWMGTPHGLLRLQDGATRSYGTADGLPHASVFAIAQDRDGSLWIGTGAGLARFRDGRFATITTQEGLPDNDVRSLLEDRDGNLWVGTADGLSSLSDGRFITYGRWEGLADPAVASVIGAAGGGVWLGTESAELVRLASDGRVRTWRLSGGLGREAVIALYEARDGGLWVALDNGRVFHLKNGVLQERTPANTEPRRKVRVFYEDEKGLAVIVSNTGLARLQGGRFVVMHPDAPGPNYPHAIHRDRQGILWMSTSRGLLRVEGNRYRVYGAREGMPHNRVRWVSEDTDGTLWIASGGGLARLVDGKLQQATLAQGIPENYMCTVLDDGLGHLWIAGQGNLFRVEKRELQALAEGRLARLSPVRFDTSDGLRTTETVLSNNPAFRAPDGRLWFATTKGVSVVDPRQVGDDRPAPPVELEGLTVDGVAGDIHGTHEYGPGRAEVNIEYSAISFASPHKIEFRYRLQGFEDAWVSAGERRFAHYGALPPGSYRFEVMASNPDGRWSGTPASLSFGIRPPFTRTALFYLLCIGALALAVAAGHRLRVARMRARFADIIGERTRIARELHDTLAQGVAGVGLQIETALRMLEQQPDSAREHLRLAHAMSKSSLDEVRRSIWVLRAQTAKGQGGLAVRLSESLRQLTAGKGPEATIEIHGQPRPLPVAVERNLLRIAHEAVSNAVRHSEAETMNVVLDFGDDGLLLRVRDDGRGFDFESHLAASGVEHFGLLGISERARALGGELRVESRLGEGTEVFCRIPYGARADSADREIEAGEGGEL
jgi:signal transduction histidine kinase/ligand-binding sensor domain-containing protein